MSVDAIILNVGGLKRLPFQIIPLDSNREPILFGNRNQILLIIFFLNIIQGPKKESYLGHIFLEFTLPLLNPLKILGHEANEVPHIRLVDPLPGLGFDYGVVNGESKFQCRHEAKRYNGCFFLPTDVKDGQSRIRMGEIDPDSFLFLEIEFESVMLILHSVLKEYLFYFTGIILHGLECRLHFLNHVKDSVFIRLF